MTETHVPRKRFGQHFLHDQGILRRIVETISPKPGERIVEIGPGEGALTLPLLRAAGRMTAIELDRDLIEPLREKSRGIGELTIISADVLTVDFTALANGSRLRVVGNLPYNISTPILFHCLDHAGVIDDMYFMLQKEVVDRMAAPPGSKTYGRLSVMLQLRCNVEPVSYTHLEGEFDAMVTAPVQKSIINDAGISFSGHTEFLANRAKCRVAMMLVAPGLRVVLATTHLPLAEVPKAITPDGLVQTLRITYNDLRYRFGFESPRIAVLGLNPHAGENGYLGHEEIEIITPAIDALRSEGWLIDGPLSADTAFLPSKREQTDAYLAMYHDQGLPVLKALGFGDSVNVTLGLPFIRTSVDHGTALSLAGTGNAEPESLIAATEMAIEMVAASS